MNSKPFIAFFLVIIIAAGLLITQNRVTGVSNITITAKEIESWFKLLPPEQLKGMVSQPEPKKLLVDNLKEMFTLSQEAERVGLAANADAQSELDIMEKVTLAGLYRNLKQNEDPKLIEVTEVDKEEYFKKNPNAFNDFITANARLKTASESQREALRPQFAELMILLERAKKSGLEKDPGYKLMFQVQRASYLATRVQQQLRGSLPVSDDEIKQQYEIAKADFEETRARHILVMYPEQRKTTEEAMKKAEKKEGEAAPAPTVAKPATKEEAKKLAEDILAKIKVGEDFAKLAQTYSDDPGSGQMGGDLGFFKKDVSFVEPFKSTVFGLKPGEMSGIVETQFGYHIIKVDERRIPELDEGLKAELKEKVLDKKFLEKIDSLKAKNTVVVEEGFNFPAIDPNAVSPPPPAHANPQANPQANPTSDGHEGHDHGEIKGAETEKTNPQKEPVSKETGKEPAKETGKASSKAAKTNK
ncbi:MAG: peptidylprolyl isomerase [Blastocatellia bacterium]